MTTGEESSRQKMKEFSLLVKKKLTSYKKTRPDTQQNHLRAVGQEQ